MNNIHSKQRHLKKGKIKGIPTFLQKLLEILEDSSNSPIITWSDNGKSFIIKQISNFSEKILPKYYKHNNFASFVRQV
jgi:heat shock transcription factor